MKYLENHKVIHIPVDTYDLPDVPNDMYPKISNTSEKYNNLVKMNYLLSCQQGFLYLNSIGCSDMLEKICNLEGEIIERLNDKILFDTYKSWQLVTDSRDNEMLKNIYDYSQNHCYNNAIFITGAEHRKSIINKIHGHNSKYKVKQTGSLGTSHSKRYTLRHLFCPLTDTATWTGVFSSPAPVYPLFWLPQRMFRPFPLSRLVNTGCPVPPLRRVSYVASAMLSDRRHPALLLAGVSIPLFCHGLSNISPKTIWQGAHGFHA